MEPKLENISIFIPFLMQVGNQAVEFTVEILCGMDRTVNVEK